MESQVTNNANALRLFFTEDVFLVEDKTVKNASDVTLEAVLSKSAIEINDAAEAPLIVETEGNKQDKLVEDVKNYVQNAEISPVVETPEVPRTYKFLGGNRKSVLILVNDSTNDVSTEQGRELLRKIVKAIDLATPDFALVNYANYPGTDFIELHQFFKPGLMLAFGVEAKHLKLNLNWAGEIILHESTKIIFAPDLHALDSDIAAKKSLWGNLQKIK
ncbi:hypothetical protein [Pedobacter rhodius]|uniref:Uncharacterized protein n=1 Tax=Pedobacter rhodius TaxID=3004098 RepID=A0ABT4L5X4_9SPHI|nr:hypothetical protein [Pedobacter sp. SJ11]MCZ4225463.1 hypothetical protein [Pedobacter sp. SJ11]